MAEILILDTDQEVREMIATQVEKDHHKAVPVETASEATAYLEKKKPDLIILDLMLPDKDGLEYVTQLMEHERTKNIPIIIVSAIRQKRKIVEGLKAGAIDYITKPFEPVELKVRVAAALKVHDLQETRRLNQEMGSMKETAKTIQYEIELPMNEMQKCLIQLRNEMEDFDEADKKAMSEALDLYAKLETILGRVQATGS
jgi:DNA-binding response OmpR family regulator